MRPRQHFRAHHFTLTVLRLSSWKQVPTARDRVTVHVLEQMHHDDPKGEPRWVYLAEMREGYTVTKREEIVMESVEWFKVADRDQAIAKLKAKAESWFSEADQRRMDRKRDLFLDETI